MIQSSPKKSCSLDPVPFSVFKDCLPVLISAITNIINASLQAGTFRRAEVTPPIKKPSLDKDLLSNYRPVSNLTLLLKVLERVVSSRIKTYLEDNHLTEPLQSAYRSSHSTETALLKVQGDLLFTLDANDVAYLVLLDLLAAYDTIDQNILLKCLNKDFSMSDCVLSWLTSYLSGRMKCVTVNGVSSEEVQLEVGVPQGLVLGPLLFTLYTSKLPGIVDKHGVNLQLFADDIQLYAVFKFKDRAGAKSTLAKLESCISDVKVWMVLNRLQLNDAKTEFPIVVSPQQEAHLNLSPIRVGGADTASCAGTKPWHHL